jgi:DNA-binding CsgD family transcriptional regulator
MHKPTPKDAGGAPPLKRGTELRVAVVEEHEIIRRGLVACLTDDPSIDVTAIAAENFATTDADVAVVSEDAAATYTFACPVVVCAGHPAAVPPLAAGNEVAGVLDRGELTSAQLHATVRAAAAGLNVNPHRNGALHEQIAPRAMRVLELIAEGHSTREIADRMSYSERTIKKEIMRLEEKMRARSRAQMVALAMRRGLI